MGSPMRLATPTMSRVPMMACATPPPCSPAGAGVLVKKSSDRLPAPLISRSTRMKKSGRRATITAPTMSPTITLLKARRRRRRFMLRMAFGSQGFAPGAGTAGHAPDEEARPGIHDHRNEEQQEGDVRQRGEMHVSHRLRELVGDRRGHGVARSEEGGGD